MEVLTGPTRREQRSLSGLLVDTAVDYVLLERRENRAFQRGAGLYAVCCSSSPCRLG